jgi:ATP-dependent helicase/nuclease subunit A
LVAQLGRWVAREEPHDGAPVTAPTDAAVRVMNLHKVKGLQAPVVFLADPCGANDRAPLLHVDRSTTPVRGYLALTGPTNAFGAPGPVLAHPPGWAELAAREEKFAAAEKNRLLYVAATRAQDEIFISFRAKRRNENPWEPLADSVAGVAALPDPGPQPAATRSPVPVTSADVVAARAELAARWAVIRPATYTTRAAKPPVSGGRPTVAGADSDGMRWGSAIHLLLEGVMRSPAGDLPAAAVSALRAVELDEALAPAAVEVVRGVMSSMVWQRALAAGQRLTEVPVVVALPAENGTVVRAVIDLAFAEAEGWVLVDYKTDQVKAMGPLVEKYGEQLRTYAVCWEQATGLRVKELGIYATRLAQYVVVPR